METRVCYVSGCSSYNSQSFRLNSVLNKQLWKCLHKVVSHVSIRVIITRRSIEYYIYIYNIRLLPGIQADYIEYIFFYSTPECHHHYQSNIGPILGFSHSSSPARITAPSLWKSNTKLAETQSPHKNPFTPRFSVLRQKWYEL